MKNRARVFIYSIIALFVFAAGGCDSDSKDSKDASPPVFPSWIDATDAAFKERVTVSWEEISNADYYVIIRSESGRFGDYKIVDYQIPASSYYDEDVAPGKTYYYRVKAINSAGESVYGPSDDGTTMKDTDTETVTRPSWVSATKATDPNYISIAWEDTGADYYNIYRKENNDGVYVLIQEQVYATTYTDYDVETGVHYLYKIEAVVDETGSEFSQYAEGYADVPSDLSPAEFYEILKPIVEQVWLVIDQNDFLFPMTIDGAYGGSIYAEMKGVYNDDDEFTGSTVTLQFSDYNQEGHIANGTLTLDLDTILQGTETGTLTITGAHVAEVEFHITIGPRPDGHSSEQGGYYIISSGGTTETVEWREPDTVIVLYPPENVQASDGEYFGYVQIQWDASSRAVNYKVYRSDYAYGTYTLIAESIAVTNYNDYDVEAGKDYYYKIVACYGDIESEASTWNKGYAGSVAADLPAPTGVTASDGTYASWIEVSWIAVSGADYYRVYRSSSSIGSYALVSGDITGLSFDDYSVSDSVQYYYRVRAYNSSSVESEYSTYDSGYAGAVVGMPDAPENVSATDRESNDTEKVVITWDAVGDAEYYLVYRSTSADGSYALISGYLPGTSYQDTTMDLDTVYYYRVTAVNDVGESSFSDADAGSRQITVYEFYYYIFRPASKYAKDRIYDRFPEPNIGDDATFYGDCSGTMHFVVTLGGWVLFSGFWGKTTITYTNLNDGDLNKATTGTDEGGITLDGVISGKVWSGSGDGEQTGTLEVTGSHTGTCVYHLTIEDKITSGGYTTVTYNGETEDIDYVNTDDE
ncbi:MAG TPA: hypothetical protein PK926_02630 [Spirochaetota bacterium]|nr:hypothetical protein [Spirochaetota bacterium]HPR46735.1 hypothetical protein [Spirochaetota bacterium]